MVAATRMLSLKMTSLSVTQAARLTPLQLRTVLLPASQLQSSFQRHTSTPFPLKSALCSSFLPPLTGSASLALVKRPCRNLRAPGVAGSALCTECSLYSPANLFTFATAFVVPFYAAMLAAPKSKWTRKLMDSSIPYIFLGLMYLYLLAMSWTPDHLRLMFSSKYWLPELPGITSMFSSSITVASAWIHLLAVDLFAGRHVYLDSLQHNLESRHSLVLCLMFGPVGIFAHLLTKNLTLWWRQVKESKGASDVPSIGVRTHSPTILSS